MSAKINLVNTTDKLSLTRSSAAAIDVHVSYVDISTSTFDPTGVGRQNFSFSSAATDDILSGQAASTCRTPQFMSVRNKDASLSCDVTPNYNANGTLTELHKETLLPGYLLEWIDGVGFYLIKPALNDNRLITNIEPSDGQQVFRSVLPTHSFAAVGGFLTISGTAYYVYIGRAAQDITPKFVDFHITSAGAGTDTKEVGLFSTPSPPNRSAQTLTKIVATGTVDSGTTIGVKRNTTAFTTLVTKGTHLWAAARFALTTTLPTVYGLERDMSQGHVLTTTGGGALTGVTTASGGLVAVTTNQICPDLGIAMV